MYTSIDQCKIVSAIDMMSLSYPLTDKLVTEITVNVNTLSLSNVGTNHSVYGK